MYQTQRCACSASIVSSERSKRAWYLLAWWFAAAIALVPADALAQLNVTASATGIYQYDSNVFELSNGFNPPFGGTAHGDSYYAYTGLLDSTYLLSLQKLFLNLTGSEYRYDRFNELDHSEYKLDAGWNWAIGSIFDGTLESTRTRAMVSFYNLINDQLTLSTEQREDALAGMRFLSDWRVELSGMTRTVDEPLLGAPQLRLDESSGEVAFKYIGTAGVTAGWNANYLAGQFKNVGIAFEPAYHQVTANLTATDEISGFSTFTGQAGYTRRSSPATLQVVSGVTGDLDYKRVLTGKTSLEADVNRQINSYIAAFGSEVDTNASLNVKWQATHKINVALGYQWTHRLLPGQRQLQLVPAVTVGDRHDNLSFVNLLIDYEALPWLAVKPYANYVTRRSDSIGAPFDESIVGVRFSLQWMR